MMIDNNNTPDSSRSNGGQLFYAIYEHYLKDIKEENDRQRSRKGLRLLKQDEGYLSEPLSFNCHT